MVTAAISEITEAKILDIFFSRFTGSQGPGLFSCLFVIKQIWEHFHLDALGIRLK